jgi:hypothetical protein
MIINLIHFSIGGDHLNLMCFCHVVVTDEARLFMRLVAVISWRRALSPRQNAGESEAP